MKLEHFKSKLKLWTLGRHWYVYEPYHWGFGVCLHSHGLY